MRAGRKVTAVVPAAGVGKRFGVDKRKQFEELGGRPMVVRTFEALAGVHEIDEIIPVVKEEDMSLVEDLLVRCPVGKIKRLAPGGRERQDSVFHGLKLVSSGDGTVVIHDGARPLVEPDIVREALGALEGYDGVVVGVPLKDTVKEVRESVIRKTLERETLWSIQTPQIFFFHVIFKAYETAMEEGFYATDDAALVERYGGRVRVIAGSYRNIKITTAEDLLIAEAFLR